MKIDTQCILQRGCYSAAVPFSTKSDNDESKKNPWIDFVCPRGIKQTTFGRESLSSSQMTTKAQKQSNFLVLQPLKIYLSAASETTWKDTHKLIRSLFEGKECLLRKVMSDSALYGITAWLLIHDMWHFSPFGLSFITMASLYSPIVLCIKLYLEEWEDCF